MPSERPTFPFEKGDKVSVHVHGDGMKFTAECVDIWDGGRASPVARFRVGKSGSVIRLRPHEAEYVRQEDEDEL